MYKKDTELFLVRCKLCPDGYIASKREIQSRLTKADNDGIYHIESLTISLGENVPFSYFAPKDLADIKWSFENQQWHRIIEKDKQNGYIR